MFFFNRVRKILIILFLDRILLYLSSKANGLQLLSGNCSSTSLTLRLLVLKVFTNSLPKVRIEGYDMQKKSVFLKFLMLPAINCSFSLQRKP